MGETTCGRARIRRPPLGWPLANRRTGWPGARDKEIDRNMRSGILITMSIVMLGQEVLAQSGEGAPTWRPVVMGKNGMVAAEHPLQALAGLRVLQSGGNAVDAAVAVFYMTSVTEPSEAGLGGDGFILAYIKQLNRVVLVNGSGGAPKLATREFY